VQKCGKSQKQFKLIPEYRTENASQMQPIAWHVTFTHNTSNLVTGLDAFQTFYKFRAITPLTYQLGCQAKVILDQLQYTFILNPLSKKCYRGTKFLQLTQSVLCWPKVSIQKCILIFPGDFEDSIIYQHCWQQANICSYHQQIQLPRGSLYIPHHVPNQSLQFGWHHTQILQV